MPVRVEVWGDFACFARPEFTVANVSYDVMPPFAACGLLESVFWHPGMKWIADCIHVCAPICFTTLVLPQTAGVPTACCLSPPKAGVNPQFLLGKNACLGTPKTTVALCNVHYVIDAHFEMTDKAAKSDNPGKFQDMFTRRLAKGRFYKAPYLGFEEFGAKLAFCKKLPPCPEELKGKRDIGYLLHSIDYTDAENKQPRFFRAIMQNGVLDVSKAVLLQ